MSRLMPGDRLDNSEIRQKLLAAGVLEELLDDVLQQFWFQDFLNSFISFPDHYVILERYLLQNQGLPFSRPNFYGFFFREVLGANYSSVFPHLQKLALAFESAHTDGVPVSRLPEVVSDLGGMDGLDILSILTVETKLAVIQEIKEMNENPYLVWKHHTLTEYLASTVILAAEDPIKYAASLMVLDQEGVVAFKNSWYGTFRFLIESEQGAAFTQWLLEFGEEHPDNIDDQYGEILLWSDPTKLSDDIRGRVFEVVYGSYQKKRLWIPVWSRERISKFVLSKHLELIESDIEPTDDVVETFVHRGNVVAVIGGLLKASSPVLSHEEKQKWKVRLVQFANDRNDNGVLQRHSLDALETYKDASLIDQVKVCLSHPDSLVREAFIQFAYTIAPNLVDTVNYLVEALKNGMTIYARYGLYEITEKEPMILLLQKFVTDNSFRKEFFDHESIFDDKESGDKKLIDHIKAIADSDVIFELKKFITASFENSEWYLADDSPFVASMARLIVENDAYYPLEIIRQIRALEEQGKDRAAYNYDNLLPMLVTEDSMEEFLKRAAELYEGRKGSDWIVYQAKWKYGREDLYKYAIEHELVPPLIEPTPQEKPKNVLERFLQFLEPEPGKYSPDVFRYFVEAQKEIEKDWSEESKSRFIKLVTDSLGKIDPREIKVKIADKSKHPNQYTISSVSAYFGKVIAAAHIVCPEILVSNRQKIVDFIPYAYSEDQQTILRVVEKLEDSEMSFVNSVFGNKNDDRRYLLPSSYLYLVEKYQERQCQLPNVQPVLQSLFQDPLISEQDRSTSLELWGKHLSNSDTEGKTILESIISSDKGKEFTETANALLITVFKDEAAIQWRFDQIKARVVPVGRQEQFKARSISRSELELDSLAFAQPLLDLNDPQYLPHFLDLLKYSLEVIDGDTSGNKWVYGNYLWKITTAFVTNLKSLGSFQPLFELQKWFEGISPSGESRWLVQRLVEVRKEYINDLGANKLYGDNKQ